MGRRAGRVELKRPSLVERPLFEATGSAKSNFRVLRDEPPRASARWFEIDEGLSQW